MFPKQDSRDPSSSTFSFHFKKFFLWRMGSAGGSDLVAFHSTVLAEAPSRSFQGEVLSRHS